MRSPILICCLLALLVCGAPAEPVFVVPLKGEVSQAQFIFLRRALKEAEREKASAVILDMDTYGGELKAATKMLDALFKMSVPTITYINTNAGSAGALVALSTKKIYMAPVSAIGAAAPVSGGGEELSATMTDKIVSYFSGYFRSAAERNGYNPDIAEAFINKNKEVKIGNDVIHAKGSVLTFSAQEATRVTDGKPLLAAGVASSLDDLVKKASLAGPLRVVEPTGFEKLAFWITALAPLFLLIGIVGAYLEFKMQGTMIPGVIAAVAFLIFFTGHYIAGLSGWEVGVVFFIGLAMVVSELVLHPGTVIPGVAGVLLMLGALLWAMIDRYPGEPFLPTVNTLSTPLLNMGIALIAAVIVTAILAKYLPHTTMYKRFVLGTSNPSGPSFSEASVTSPRKVHVGVEGVAQSMLRPTGNAEFDGDVVVDVVTRGEFVEPGTKIRVIEIEGSRIVVERTGHA